MKFDELASAWQEQNETPLSPQDREMMVVRVCRNVERLNSKVVGRDAIELIVGLFGFVFFSWYFFTAPADHVVSRIGAAFLVCWIVLSAYWMYRARTIRRPASLDAPVREFCRTELDRIERQIQLLRSVLWWYILPCMLGVNVMFVGLAGVGPATLAYGVTTLLIGWGLYVLNMRTVASELVPVRNALAGLLNQLEDSRVVDQPTDSPSRPRRGLLVMVLLAMLVVLGVAVVLLLGQRDDYPKRAPFTGVRWEGSTPLVEIDGEWYILVALDGVPAGDIVSFSRWTYVDRWRKRFEEDLVEVLTRMGHPPQDTVTLIVQLPGASETTTLEGVAMTEENRRAIYAAASKRRE